jgi:hypothetical protein
VTLGGSHRIDRAARRRIAEYIQASRALSVEALIITSPFASFVIYSLRDAYWIHCIA